MTRIDGEPVQDARASLQAAVPLIVSQELREEKKRRGKGKLGPLVTPKKRDNKARFSRLNTVRAIEA